MCGECRFKVVEVGWNKRSWPRCSVEPTRLRRVFAIGVGIRAEKNTITQHCGDPFRVEGSECGQKGRGGRECCAIPDVQE